MPFVPFTKIQNVFSVVQNLGVPIPDIRSALTVLLAGLVSIPFRYIHGFEVRLIADIICGLMLSFIASGYWGLISLSTVILTYSVLYYSQKIPKERNSTTNTPKGIVITSKYSKKESKNSRKTPKSSKENSPTEQTMKYNASSPNPNPDNNKVSFTRISIDVVLVNFALLLVLQVFKRRKAENALSPSLFYNWISQQMILFQKLAALAFNSNESFRQWINRNKGTKGSKKSQIDLSPNPLTLKHHKVLSFIVLLGYSFTTNGSLAGGYVEFDAYNSWLEERNKNVFGKMDTLVLPWPSCKGDKDKSKGNIKRSTLVKLPNRAEAQMTVRKKSNILFICNYLEGCFWLIIYGVFGKKARELLTIGTKEFNGITIEQDDKSGAISKVLALLKLFGSVDLDCFIFRTKYYFVWKIFRAITLGNYFSVSQSSTGPSGVTYDVAKNIDIPKVEFPLNSRDSMAAWNINTTNWFRHYIYMALISQPGFLGQKPVATLITNISSALWHGISGGYYLFFIGFSLCVMVGRIEYRHITPFIYDIAKEGKIYGILIRDVYHLVSRVMTRIEKDLFLPFFILLKASSGFQYFRNFHWAPLLWVVGRWGSLKLLAFILSISKSSKKRQRSGHIEAKKN